MTDFDVQRQNMVESQVRPSDITDRRIVRAMLEVPREAFAPEAVRPLAYMDQSLPVSQGSAGRPGRCLLPPRTFAKMVQAAGIEPQAVVLDVGCATGYSSAVLARLAAKVVALEADEALAKEARRTLAAQGVANAVVVEGPLTAGAAAHAPYDAILINGAVAQVGETLLGQLKDGGRLVAVLVNGPVGRVNVWRRSGATVDARPAFDAGADVLPGFERKAAFVL